MKRSIDNVDGLDDKGKQAKIPNQPSGSDALRSSSDTPEHLESASNTKNSLATSFAQQESVLREEQIESLKGFDKEVVGIVLDKITLDACKGHPGALNAISGVLGSFDKEELKAIFQASPGTLNKIAGAASKGHPNALNGISQELAKFDKDELKGIFQNSPYTLSGIAWSACNGHPNALNVISRELAKFSKEELKGIFQRSPHTLSNIAHAACEGPPNALNAISGQLANFSQEELKGIFQRSPHTLSNIAWAACEGHPDALNAIIGQLASFSKEELKGIFQSSSNMLKNIAVAAGKGHPDALNAISTKLRSFTKKELKAIFQNSPHTLNEIAVAAAKGHPNALNAISQELAKFDKDELEGIFQNSPHTLNEIAVAAAKGHPNALNVISRELAKFSKEELKGIFQNSPHTLNEIAWAACEGHPDALNAISEELAKFSKEELKAIFQSSNNTLSNIAHAACNGHPDALNAISEELAKFDKDELKAIFQNSPVTLNNITHAACEGHSDALHAVLVPLDGVMDLENQAVREYCYYLNDKFKHCLFQKPNRLLGLERAFRDLGTATFARITTRVPSKIISQLEKSINWYKEFTAISNENASDQADISGTEFQMQENLSARVYRFINDNVLQRDRDQTSREPRIDFVKNLCDYLTMMGHHHIVLGLSNICRTYQSGLDGYYGFGYADSVLGELYRTLAQPSGTYLFAASQESDAERDKRYKKAYGMLKSFNENLGLWIQFKPGRDPLSAQDTVVEHFKVLLRAYLNALGDRNIDDDIDYDDVDQILKEKDWDAFLDCRNRFFVNELEDAATSSSSFQPSSHRP